MFTFRFVFSMEFYGIFVIGYLPACSFQVHFGILFPPHRTFSINMIRLTSFAGIHFRVFDYGHIHSWIYQSYFNFYSEIKFQKSLSLIYQGTEVNNLGTKLFVLVPRIVKK